jgi:uncharacterized membrane protein YgcG
MYYTLFIFIFAAILFYQYIVLNKKVDEIQIQQKNTEPVISETSPLPYWVYYGQPTYWPAYLSPYWYYDVPFNGPVSKPWGPSGRHSYRPGHGPGYSGVAVGGGGGGGGGGHGGH